MNKQYFQWGYQLVVLGGVIFCLFTLLRRNDKIAYVDSVKVLNAYKGSQVAKNAYQKKANIWQANIDTLTGEIKEAIGKYEYSLAHASKGEQAVLKNLIQAKQKQLSDYQQAVQNNARQEDAQLTKGVVTQINSFIAGYGKKNHYKLILIASQAGTIAYAQDGLDITEDVLKQLNEDYKYKN